jgi:cytochrome c biogenesis protein CcdA
MTEAAFAGAFLAGILSLLAPCSALLLPAFFAYAFTSPTQLLGRTLIFLAGLCTIFVPLGLGASIISLLLIEHRSTTILVAGLLLIGFGVLKLIGRGFSVDLVPPEATARMRGGHGLLAVYGTGLAYGLSSGFCAGPLLGTVLTLAGTAPSPAAGALLLFTYGFGTAAPLFLIALFWDRFHLGERAWLRGRPIKIGRFEVHTQDLLAGVLLILLGAGFIAFQGASALTGYYVDLGLEDLGYGLQVWVVDTLPQVPRAVWIVAAGLILLAIVAGLSRRLRSRYRAWGRGRGVSGPGTRPRREVPDGRSPSPVGRGEGEGESRPPAPPAPTVPSLRRPPG